MTELGIYEINITKKLIGTKLKFSRNEVWMSTFLEQYFCWLDFDIHCKQSGKVSLPIYELKLEYLQYSGPDYAANELNIR